MDNDFKFDLDGLVCGDSDPAASTPIWNGQPPLVPKLTIDTLMEMRRQLDVVCGAQFPEPQTLIINEPDWSRTAAAIDMQRASVMPELLRMQHSHNLMMNSMLDIIKVQYPLTRRVQIRFPRSKKKRIRNKWKKQSRNYAEVPCAWLMNRKHAEK